MTTQIIEASQGLITNEMQNIAEFEMFEAEALRNKIALGDVVVLKNNQRQNQEPLGFGEGLGVKINTTFDIATANSELLDMIKIIKLSGGHSILEKGASEDMREKRAKLLAQTTLPYGAIPIYQSAFENSQKNKSISKLTKKKMLEDIETCASAGVDFVVLNASLTSEILATAKENNNEIFSPSAKILAYWIEATEKENPYYEAFDEVLDILRTYDVALCLELSLKDTTVSEFLNKNQIKELLLLGELVRRARNSGVQVFVDAIGHVSLNNIEYLIKTVKKLTANAPLMATSTCCVDSEDTQGIANTSVVNSFLAYFGVDFIQSVEIPKTTGYFNAKQLKEAIESALVVAKSVDCAKGTQKALYEEAEYIKNKEEKASQSASEFIKNLFS